jgi:hypothetical protein
MQSAFHRLMRVPVAVVLCWAGTGCDEGDSCIGCQEDTAFVEEPCCEPMLSYVVEVPVTCGDGCVVPGARVELMVASVPETRLVAVTDGGGVAYFEVLSAPDVTVIAYACADGYPCGDGAVVTVMDTNLLSLPVCLACL